MVWGWAIVFFNVLSLTLKMTLQFLEQDKDELVHLHISVFL